MIRNDDALNREMRQLMILAFLRRRAPGRPKPDEIKSALHFAYPGTNEEAIHRRFSDDMEDLRRVGLIDYDDLRPSRRVRLTVRQKDPSLSLTLGEHAALSRARERLEWRSSGSPFVWDSGTRKLAYVVRALRLIEEGDSEVADLAEALDVRRPKVRQILDRIDGIRPISDVLVEMEIERDDSRDQAEAAYVRLGGSDRPLAGRGLDEIGLFAYSRDEVDDRLALIEAALGDGDDEAGRDGAALRSAKRKLLAWRDR